MKLSSLSTARKANEGVFCHLHHPLDSTDLLNDDEKKPVGFTMLGTDSDKAIAQANAITDRMLDPKNTSKRITSEMSDRQGAEQIAALVTGKDWNIPVGWIEGTDDDTPSEFSPDNVLKMMLNPGVRWVREQANRFAGTRANFLQASSGI